MNVRLRLAALLALATAALALGAGPAQADDVYTTYTCRTPGGAPAVPDGWVHITTDPTTHRSDCLDGGTIAAGPAVVPFMLFDNFTWRFVAPPDTRIVAWTLYRDVDLSRESSGAGWNWNLMQDVWATDPSHLVEHCYQFEGCFALGDGTLSEASRIGQSGVDFGTLIAHIDCHPGPCAAGTLASMRIHRGDFTLRDTADPAFLGTPSGDLVDPTRPLAGVGSVSFSATDKGGGVYLATVEVDGDPVVSEVVDENGGRCVQPFTGAIPCKTNASGTMSFDTAALPDGEHRVRLLVSDATETNVAAFGPVRVTTRNRSPECDPALSFASSSVIASFRGTRRSGVTRRSGRTTVVGRIEQAGAGSLVHLLSRERRADASIQFAATAETGPDGSFALSVPRGPSRELIAAYRVRPTDSLLACSRTLTLRVPARARLTASPKRVRPGARVRFIGRLLGGSVPRRGKLVDFQARSGGKWRTFATARSDSIGRFRSSYRFSRWAVPATYRIRVRVRADASYPFDLGYSRAVNVRVG